MCSLIAFFHQNRELGPVSQYDERVKRICYHKKTLYWYDIDISITKNNWYTLLSNEKENYQSIIGITAYFLSPFYLIISTIHLTSLRVIVRKSSFCFNTLSWPCQSDALISMICVCARSGYLGFNCHYIR